MTLVPKLDYTHAIGIILTLNNLDYECINSSYSFHFLFCFCILLSSFIHIKEHIPIFLSKRTSPLNLKRFADLHMLTIILLVFLFLKKYTMTQTNFKLVNRSKLFCTVFILIHAYLYIYIYIKPATKCET